MRRGRDLESMLRCVGWLVVDEISRPYSTLSVPIPFPFLFPFPLLSPPSPPLVFPFPWTRLDMQWCCPMSHRSHLFFLFPVPFFYSVSPFFGNRLGSRGGRMPMDVHSRWSLVRTDWMIQGGTRHHFTGPKRRMPVLPPVIFSRRLAGYQCASVCV